MVLDRFNDVTTLLSVGNVPVNGKSPRKTLTETGRRVLLPALVAAMDNKRTIDVVVEHGTTQWSVTAKPIVTPDGTEIIGAYGIYGPTGTPYPPEPLIGAWQWTVDRSGNNVGELSSLWDKNLYALHEYDPGAVSSTKGPVGDWLTKLLPHEDRAQVKTVVDAGLSAANGIHQLLSFGAITRLGTDNPGRKQLALTGTSVPVPGSPGVFHAYGFTREVPSPTRVITSGLNVVNVADFTRAYFELASETAFVAIDCIQSYVFMTSPSWARLGFHPDFEGDLATLSPTTERPNAEAVILAARQGDPASFDPLITTLKTRADDFKAVRIRFSRVDRDVTPSRYLIAAVEEA
ncbi:hypothetical protein AX769_20850 (plasmid) [Frondihabitans sp. PAMC 28766]|nr:hypothetical protein AX769_20850 [Frondihabitans sp. PAMC 28766]